MKEVKRMEESGEKKKIREEGRIIDSCNVRKSSDRVSVKETRPENEEAWRGEAGTWKQKKAVGEHQSKHRIKKRNGWKGGLQRGQGEL